jgi:cell division protein FtsB
MQGREPNGPLVARTSRRWKPLLFVALAVVGAYLFLSGEDGFVRVRAKKEELVQLRQRVVTLETQNDSLRHRLWQLDNDVDYIEKVAREEFGMVRPGESVYRLERAIDGVKEK